MNNYNNGFNTNNYPNNQYNGGNVYNNYNQQVPSPQAQEQMNNQNSLAAGGNLYDFSQDLNGPGNGYSNENTVYTSSKKKGGGFFAFLEFLIIVFLCLYIANDKGYIHIEFLDNLIPAKEVKEEPKKEETKEEKEKEPEETVVTDKKINLEYVNKAYYVSNIGVNFDNIISPIFTKDTKIDDLSSTDKLKTIATALHTIDKAYKVIESDEEFKAVFPTKDISKKTKIFYIESAVLEEKYKMIFGEGLTKENIENTCPIFTYNDTYKKYYMDTDCITQSNGLSIDYFVYKVASIGDYYNVYMSIDTYKSNGDGTISLYKDAEQKNLYKTYSDAEFKSHKLSVDNYKEFDRYKISFKKNGDNYLFDTITKVDESDIA